MKKSTILIVVAVFLISVFVVGIFGLQNVPYNEIVYVEQIVPTSVTLSNGAASPLIRQNDSGHYYVTITYEQNLMVMINYEVVPNDATNRNVEIAITNINPNSNGQLQQNGAILMKDSGVLRVTFRATDSASGPTMVFYIYTQSAQQQSV